MDPVTETQEFRMSSPVIDKSQSRACSISNSTLKISRVVNILAVRAHTLVFGAQSSAYYEA